MPRKGTAVVFSRNVNDADQVISTNPVSASMPARNRTGPEGTKSPKPTVVLVMTEK